MSLLRLSVFVDLQRTKMVLLCGLRPKEDLWWYLLRRPADPLFESLRGEPHFDLLLGVFGGRSEPRELSLGWVGELVEGGDEGQVVVQRRVVFARVEGHGHLRHLDSRGNEIKLNILYKQKNCKGSFNPR